MGIESSKKADADDGGGRAAGGDAKGALEISAAAGCCAAQPQGRLCVQLQVSMSVLTTSTHVRSSGHCSSSIGRQRSSRRARHQSQNVVSLPLAPCRATTNLGGSIKRHVYKKQVRGSSGITIVGFPNRDYAIHCVVTLRRLHLGILPQGDADLRAELALTPVSPAPRPVAALFFFRTSLQLELLDKPTVANRSRSTWA